MKKYSKWMLMFSILFICLIVLPGILNAQPGDGDTDPDAPIDGGVGLLIAAGVGYGYKKYRNSRKNKPVGFK